MTHGISEQ